MPKLIILRLHPVKPIDGGIFTNYLNGLTITAYDLSFANNKEGNPIGQAARYLPNSNDLPNSRIFQHLAPPLNQLNTERQKVAIATAVIELSPTAAGLEYEKPDIRLQVKRDNVTIIDRVIDYNVAVTSDQALPSDLPLELYSDQYADLKPVGVYVALPAPGSEMDLQVEIPTDGSPPEFTKLKAAPQPWAIAFRPAPDFY